MVSDVANRVASGDLATEVPNSDRDDEAGHLLQAIKKMTLSLRGLVMRAKQASIELMSTATEFAATSRQQEAQAHDRRGALDRRDHEPAGHRQSQRPRSAVSVRPPHLPRIPIGRQSRA